MLHYSGIPLKLYGDETTLKEKHQAGDPETYFVRIYEFVNYLVQLFGVALFCCSVYVGRVLHQVQPANLEAMIGSRFAGVMFEVFKKCSCCHMGHI